MSNQVKNPPDLTRRARSNLNLADLPVTRLINPIVHVALKTIKGWQWFLYFFLIYIFHIFLIICLCNTDAEGLGTTISRCHTKNLKTSKNGKII
jgi:hypothetical protein